MLESLSHFLTCSVGTDGDTHARHQARLDATDEPFGARLWPFGLDILCLNSYGYLLLSRSNEQAEDS